MSNFKTKFLQRVRFQIKIFFTMRQFWIKTPTTQQILKRLPKSTT